jgi:hypothetical protein
VKFQLLGDGGVAEGILEERRREGTSGLPPERLSDEEFP